MDLLHLKNVKVWYLLAACTTSKELTLSAWSSNYSFPSITNCPSLGHPTPSDYRLKKPINNIILLFTGYAKGHKIA